MRCEICVGFEDRLEDGLMQIFFEWMRRGKYSRNRVVKLCEDFEQTEIAKFIAKHMGENEKA